MKFSITVSLSLCFLLCAPTAAEAGIHNVQSILATEADEGLSGAISGSADWRTGNVEYLFLSATPLARYRSGKHLIIGITRADHKTSAGNKIISRTFEHLRYRNQVTKRLLGEVFAQHQYDAIKRLRLRALVGGGPKVDLIDSKQFGLGVGVAYMLEYEELQEDGSADDGQTQLQHRGSTYLVGHYEIDEKVQLVETLYFQPRLTNGRDNRILNESQITVKLTDKLSFSTAFSLAYDSRPPNTIKRLDTALKSSLTLEL